MGTEREVDALASEAIAASEKEFFEAAMDAPETDADDEGDRSLETMGKGLEGQHEADDEGEGDEGAELGNDPEAKAEGQEGKEGAARDRDERGQFKPKGDEQPNRNETAAERGLRGELVGERDRRKAIETERDQLRAKLEEQDRRFAALEARLTQAPQPQQPKPQEQPAQAEIPDRWLDPEGYDRYQREQVLTQVRQERVAASFEEARAEHGTAFDEAFGAANALPDAVAKPLLDRVLRSPNPARTLMTWHKQQKAFADIGNDPTAFRERIAADTRESLMKDPEFRKQVLAELQGEARGTNGGSPRNETRLPPSLNSARGGGIARAASGDLSDAGLFEDVMR